MKTKFSGILTLFLALIVQISFAQEKTISGVVSDETGSLPGVSILKKGTAKGTETDFDGKYSINAKTGDVLVFSFVGMETIEKTVGTSNSINVTMQSANVLDEVVVLGYGTRKKNELTGSTVQLNADDIAEVPVASVDQALQGKVAGLAITGSSGTPGAVQNIRIRGVSSITAGNAPLYVIDGVPVINDNVSGSDNSSTLTALSSLNSDDIESMTVLKDASATSAYGARGANGVIVITTKSGKSGKTKFNFSTSIGYSNDAVKGRRALTAQEIIDLGYEALVNSKRFASVEEARAKYDWPLDKWGFKEGVDKGANWEETITNKDAAQKSYNLSARGGSDKHKFYASLGYSTFEATVIGADLDRITGSFNFDKDLANKLKLSTKSSVSNTSQNGIMESSAFFASPRTTKYFANPMAGLPYNEDGSINTKLKTNLYNPLYIMKHNVIKADFTRFMNNSSLKYDFTNNLEFKTSMSFDHIVRDRKVYNNRKYGGGKDTNGYGWVGNFQNTNMVWQNSLDYKWSINDEHKLDLKGLIEYQQNKAKFLLAEGEEFSTDGLTNLDTAGKPKGVGSSTTDWYTASYMAMANYGFKNKLFIDLTYRYEGSSRFPKDKRFGHFWAIGGAWNVHKESFISDVEAISNLKLRASYGINGNSNIDLNTYQAFFAYDSDYAGEGAAYPSSFGNSDLTWEKNSLLDIGFDLGLFKDKFTATFSYYTRRTYDLLLEVPLSLTTGHNQQNKNVGEMENKGIEVELNADIIKSDDFNFSIGGNFATVKNNVSKLAKDSEGKTIEITTGSRKVAEGHPVYSWYMRKYAGVNPDNGNAQWYKNGENGELTEKYSEAKRAFVGGSALPTLTGGVNTNLDYKGFFLNANIYFATGHKVFESWANYLHQGGAFNLQALNGVEDLLRRWQKPGDKTDVPKILWGDYNRDRSSTSTRFLYDGDYMRLKDVTLGYNIPSKLLNKTFLNSVKLYAKGTNLYTWVKDDKLKNDPETEAAGFVGLTTPPVKTLSLGVNLNF